MEIMPSQHSILNVDNIERENCAWTEMTHLNPAQYVVHLFKGIRPASRALSVSPTTIARWLASGFIPSRRQSIVLDMAKANRLDLKPEDLILGRDISGQRS